MYLNGVKTKEPCPICQNPDMIIEHGRSEQPNGEPSKKFQHFELCPECGDSMPHVAYDCAGCREAEI